MRKALRELSQPGAGKFRTAKELLRLSERRPSSLYPYFTDIQRFLQSDNQIIRWTAIRIVGNLAAVTPTRRIAGMLDEYLAPLPGPSLVAACNTIGGAARIALSHPSLAPKIIAALLDVERGRYRTPECRNVAIGHVLTALASMGPKAAGVPRVLAFVKRQRKNPRASTRAKAESFLKAAAPA